MAQPTLEKPEPCKPGGAATARDAGNSSNIDVCVQGLANAYISPAGADMKGLLADARQHKHYEFHNIGVGELASKVEEATGILTPEREDCGNGVIRMSCDVFMSGTLYDAVERVNESLNP